MLHRQSTRPAPAQTTGRHRDARGQAIVEFAAVLLPLLMIIVGIIQFGLLFGANVSLTNAAREGARDGTVYLFSGTDKLTNDKNRCTAVLQGAKSSFGLISTTSPSAADDCASSSTVLANDARRGYRMTVTLTYRSDIIVPFVGEILSTDANGRLVQTARATMVIN